MFKYGFANHSEFDQKAHTVVVFTKGIGTMYQAGKFYVMNENGKTVAQYNLRRN